MFLCLNVFSLFVGIDGPVTHSTPPDPLAGGLLVNVGSEEVESTPKSKVCIKCNVDYWLPSCHDC